MSERIGGIYVSCPKCFANGATYVGRYVWYVNQYGAKVRVFCHCCGTVADKTNRNGITNVVICNWTVDIVYPRRDDEIPF